MNLNEFDKRGVFFLLNSRQSVNFKIGREIGPKLQTGCLYQPLREWICIRPFKKYDFQEVF